MTDMTRRKLLLRIAAALPAAYIAPKVFVTKAHASGSGAGNNGNGGNNGNHGQGHGR